jgi:hypothetical protein
VVQERGCTARHLWLAIENYFLDNHEQRTLHLDTVFHNFVQGDLSVLEYCRKFKTMANGLVDLGSPIEDWILVLNISELSKEEIHMDNIGPSAAPSALYTNDAPPTAKPPSSTPSRPLSGGNSGNSDHWNKNNNKNRNGGHGGGNNGRNSNGSGGRNSSSGQTTAPTASDGRTGTPWPTYGHP